MPARLVRLGKPGKNGPDMRIGPIGCTDRKAAGATRRSFPRRGQSIGNSGVGWAHCLPLPVLRGRTGEGAGRNVALVVGETASGKSPLPNPPPEYRGREPFRQYWNSATNLRITFLCVVACLVFSSLAVAQPVPGG